VFINKNLVLNNLYSIKRYINKGDLTRNKCVQIFKTMLPQIHKHFIFSTKCVQALIFCRCSHIFFLLSITINNFLKY